MGEMGKGRTYFAHLYLALHIGAALLCKVIRYLLFACFCIDVWMMSVDACISNKLVDDGN